MKICRSSLTLCWLSQAATKVDRSLEMEVFYFQMFEIVGWSLLYWTLDRNSDIRDVLFRSDQVESRRLVVKLIAEDVLFQMLETDHFGEKILRRVVVVVVISSARNR